MFEQQLGVVSRKIFCWKISIYIFAKNLVVYTVGNIICLFGGNDGEKTEKKRKKKLPRLRRLVGLMVVFSFVHSRMGKNERGKKKNFLSWKFIDWLVIWFLTGRSMYWLLSLTYFYISNTRLIMIVVFFWHIAWHFVCSIDLSVWCESNLAVKCVYKKYMRGICDMCIVDNFCWYWLTLTFNCMHAFGWRSGQVFHID